MELRYIYRDRHSSSKNLPEKPQGRTPHLGREERLREVNKNAAHGANQERTRSLREAMLRLGRIHDGRWLSRNAVLECQRAIGREKELDLVEVDLIGENSNRVR